SAPRGAVAVGGAGQRRERDHRLKRQLLHVGGERVVPPEQPRHHQPPHRHHHVLPGALLVPLRWRPGLRPVRPHHVLQQRPGGASGAGDEPVGDELAGAVEHLLVAGGERLVPEQQLPLADLVRRVVALDDHVAPRAPVLELHRRVHAQRLPHHRLHQRHLLLHGGDGDLAAAGGRGGADLGG
ncbi:Os02g0218750, partial [Oryza sativa Japonica Group]